MTAPHLRGLQVETVAVASLSPHARNARTHSARQIRQIADSIRSFGWTNPILVDGAGSVIAGHGRLEAAKQLGLSEVPTIRIEDMTEAQKRAYVIADNKLAENAGWDRELLALELQDLLQFDIDITLTGFEMGEIDVVIGELGDKTVDAADRSPGIDLTQPAVSRPGDLWQLGDHRLLCGDATQDAAYQRLLQGEQVRLVFTDPPYNVPVDGHVCGLGSVRHAEFAMASGEMSEAEFQDFLKTVLERLAAHSVDGAIHFVCMDWRHIAGLLAAGKPVYGELKNLCVWAKTNGGMGSLYRSQHELVAVFKVGRAAHVNNVALGQHGRYRTNVWTYPGINALGGDRDENLAIHPTVKPVALVADAIQDCSNRKELVLDAFAGSGTTILAAEQVGRGARALELEPHYVDAAVQRFQTVTGVSAIHAGTGETFDQIAARRRASNQEE